nr:reverse transcriptase domain-containing protein [Tanacetum cinerariifolium]
MMSSFIQMQSSSGSGSLPSNIVANQSGDMKAITTLSGVAYEGPSIPPTSSSIPNEVEQEPKVIKDKVQTTSSKSITHAQPSVVQVPILEPDVALNPNPKPSIPYPLSLKDQKLRSDFTFEDIETFLRTPDELSNLDDDYYNTKGDILYLEKLLNENPPPNIPLIKNEDLKQDDITMMKPLIDEPPELEHKDLPSYLEYEFLEGTNKLPVIISKELKDEEKATLLKVLKSHKRAIA